LFTTAAAAPFFFPAKVLALLGFLKLPRFNVPVTPQRGLFVRVLPGRKPWAKAVVAAADILYILLIFIAADTSYH
jgi:hypothetical protein